MRNIIRCLMLFLILMFHACSSKEQVIIDRQSVVERHTVISDSLDVNSPAQVGNGEFAFGVDITGLQTFVPFNTMSHWGWHSDPVPQGMKVENFKGQMVDTWGRLVKYPLVNDSDEEQKALSNWLSGNPHRINLGRIAFSLKNPDGSQVRIEDLKNCRQEQNLWNGIISSYFEVDGIPVYVKTACHPKSDLIGVSIKSELINRGRLSVKLEFPFVSASKSNGAYIGIWDQPGMHQTVTDQKDSQVNFTRILHNDKYYVSLKCFTKTRFNADKLNPHKFELIPEKDSMQFVCAFSPETITEDLITANQCMDASKTGWSEYWQSGAAIDLSGSTDPRWLELERRIVLSQYVMKVNEAGSLPPQEAGLVQNGWFGRFHFEMIWWHGVHWALWDRWDDLDKSLGIYQKFLESAKNRAEGEGYNGARWPKCTAYNNSEWPHPCHAFLIWQQPHPIYFAELDYRLHPQKETLEKWKDVVFNTADFLVSFTHFDTARGEYVLGPPLIPVSENIDYNKTLNPAFELAYWRFGLRIADLWYKRLDMKAPEMIGIVMKDLAPLPVEDDLYVLHEEVRDMWTKYNYEHPALIGTYGMLPGDGVDLKIFENTFNKIISVWNFKRVWGWDFPMLAMAAARINKQEEAVNFLLHENYNFDQHGFASGPGSPFAYFPANGGLLTAVAMMAGGWDGAKRSQSPGFPENGKWKIKAEGFKRMP